MSLTVLLLATSVVVGQAEETNVAHQKLSVLEPFIGTWYRSGVNEQGTKFETRATYSWEGDPQTIVMGEIKSRTTEEGDEEFSDWATIGRWFFVWNSQAERIERYGIFSLWQGRAAVQEWVPKGDGVFTTKMIHSNWGQRADFTVAVTEETITTKLTNRKDADGKPLDDHTVVHEPIIGTWSRTETVEESGRKWELRAAFSWIESKAMIEGEVRFRWAAAGEDLLTKQSMMAYRVFFLWNQVAERIEGHRFGYRRGNLLVEQWLPEDDGVFAVKHLSSNTQGGTAELKATITKDQYIYASEDDRGWVMEAEGDSIDFVLEFPLADIRPRFFIHSVQFPDDVIVSMGYRAPLDMFKLTLKEAEIALRWGRGLSTNEIASELNLVKTYVSQVKKAAKDKVSPEDKTRAVFGRILRALEFYIECKKNETVNGGP